MNKALLLILLCVLGSTAEAQGVRSVLISQGGVPAPGCEGPGCDDGGPGEPPDTTGQARFLVLNEAEMQVGGAFDLSTYCAGEGAKTFELLDEPRGYVSVSSSGTLTVSEPGVYSPIVACENSAGRDSTDFLLIARAPAYVPSVITGDEAFGVDALDYTVGAGVSADALSPGNLTHGALNVTSSTNWGSGTTNRYLAATNSSVPIARTVDQAQDGTFSFWSRNGQMFLRMNAETGTGIAVDHTGESSPGGTFSIGAVTWSGSLDDNTFSWSFSGSKYFNTGTGQAETVIPGYDRADTEGDSFEITLDGLALSACFRTSVGGECVEFYRDDLALLSRFQEGYAAWKGANTSTYGMRHMTAEWAEPRTYESDFESGIIVAEEFGASTFQTTGSIATGSYDLTVADASGFEVGDRVLVGITETAGQLRGDTTGVGGYWPGRSVPTLADTVGLYQQGVSYVYVVSEDEVWRRFPTAPEWYDPEHYYVEKPVPRGLSATITEINGSVLTLDTPAKNGYSGLPVYFDNSGTDWFALLQSGSANTRAHVLGEGFYAISGSHDVNVGYGGIVGAGKHRTEIGSVPGFGSFQLLLAGSSDDYAVMRDLTIRGTFADWGYVGWDTRNGVNLNATYGARFFDIACVNVPNSCTNIQWAGNTWVYRGEHWFEDGQRKYVQWTWQWADVSSGRGGCVDCRSGARKDWGRDDRVGLVPSFESFDGRNIEFVRPIGLNATFACNSCSGLLFDHPYTYVQAGVERSEVWDQSTGNVVFNINDHMGRLTGSRLNQQILINEPRMIFEGAIDADGNIVRGIEVYPANKLNNVHVVGGLYFSESSLTANSNKQAISLRGSETATHLVDGFRTMLDAGSFEEDVELWGGSAGTIQNTVAKSIDCGSGTCSGNQTIAEWEVSRAPNEAPVASFEVWTMRGDGERLFWGWPSTDDLYVTKYEWTVEQGGSTIWTDYLPYFTLALDPGTYVVTLTVTDEDGATDSETREVVVE